MHKFKLIPLLIILLVLLTQGVSVAKESQYTVRINFLYDEIYHQENEKLYIVHQGENKSAVTDENGKFLIKPRTGRIDIFNEGLAPICINNKYGYINMAGKIVISPKWDYVDSFYEGRAWVYNNYKFGFIDTKGSYVVPLKYGYVGYFSDGAAPVLEWPSPGFTKGWKLFDVFSYGRIAGMGKWGLIDKNGKVLIKPQFESIMPITGNEKLFFISTEAKGDYKFGIVNSAGKTILKPVLDGITSFGEGWNLSAVKKNGKWGIIDRTGKIVSEFLWSTEPKPIETPRKLWIVSETINDSTFYGILDDNLKVVSETKWKSIEDFYDGMAIVSNEDGVGYITDEGKEIVNNQWYEVNRFYNGIAWVLGYRDEPGSTEDELYEEKTMNCWRPIDKNGNYLSLTGWMRVTDFTNGYAAVSKKDGKSTIIDTNLNKICDLNYNVVNCPSGNYFIFSKYNKFGLVDKAGKVINKAEWSEYSVREDLSDDVTAYVTKSSWGGSQTGFLGKSGKLIGSTFWDGDDSNSIERKDLLLPVMLKNKWGLLDIKNETVAVTPQFEEIRFMFNKNGKSIWEAKKNGKFGIIEVKLPT